MLDYKNDFNEEVEGIMGELKDSSERRSQIIHDLMEGKELSQQDSSTGEEEPKAEIVEEKDTSDVEKKEAN